MGYRHLRHSRWVHIHACVIVCSAVHGDADSRGIACACSACADIDRRSWGYVLCVCCCCCCRSSSTTCYCSGRQLRTRSAAQHHRRSADTAVARCRRSERQDALSVVSLIAHARSRLFSQRKPLYLCPPENGFPSTSPVQSHAAALLQCRCPPPLRTLPRGLHPLPPPLHTHH